MPLGARTILGSWIAGVVWAASDTGTISPVGARTSIDGWIAVTTFAASDMGTATPRGSRFNAGGLNAGATAVVDTGTIRPSGARIKRGGLKAVTVVVSAAGETGTQLPVGEILSGGVVSATFCAAPVPDISTPAMTTQQWIMSILKLGFIASPELK